MANACNWMLRLRRHPGIPSRSTSCNRPCTRRAAMSSRANRCTMRSNCPMRWRRPMGPNRRCDRRGVNGRRRDGWSHSPALCGTNYGNNPQRKQPKSPYLAHGALPGKPRAGLPIPLMPLHPRGFHGRGLQGELSSNGSRKKSVFFGWCQYFHVMSAPGGAVAVMWRAICGMMRW
jgi:hypothetical protein